MAKPKKVSYALIRRDSDAGKKLYPMMNRLVEEHHEEITNARIALAWNLTWKPDVDGRVTIGKCKRASDLDRELAPYDFVIMLRQEFFEDPTVKDEQRVALLDHELSHATVKLDEFGEPMRDTKGRVVYRLVKHDLEEFSAVVARHGIYKRDIEHFWKALQKSKQKSLLEPEEALPTRAVAEAFDKLVPRPGSGIESVSFSSPVMETVTITAKDAENISRLGKGMRRRAH